MHWLLFNRSLSSRSLFSRSTMNYRAMNHGLRPGFCLGLRVLLRLNWRTGMRCIFFVVYERRGLHSRCHRRLGRCWRQSGLPSHPVEIGIHDDLAVIAQVHRFELVELLPPLLHMRHVGLVALQIIRRAKMHQHFADSTHGICSSCSLRWASGTKKILRPISSPITSMMCACATCSAPLTSI